MNGVLDSDFDQLVMFYKNVEKETSTYFKGRNTLS